MATIQIEDYKISKYVEGWRVSVPRYGKDKNDNPKTHWDDKYFPRLDGCLRFIRDSMAKECESVIELISLLEQARDIDEQVLAASGLTGA